MCIMIKKVIEKAIQKGVSKKEIAKAIYPDCSDDSRMVKMGLLLNGKTKRFTCEQVVAICNVCGVKPNDIFI